ncbi:dolichyl-diphosphooligosaccharide--protein glycosyltransferase subunit 1A [Ricinus communis]|uniref:Dolichyl-diphosphooligosaccharide--protein glycosyltransferase subunit 1 n=1 Tax=Ricinus communis TaxID=3988 RepID=B9R8R9_RICCO|nr:dolichyl-diphosphooligosaccharide--protein glycosyltransferase subunit 1A [Ricinus communis]EEF52899.1 ribophorin, putative [Ricinus communis]|eukprot:XP_002510712.1 dolichyl-diphosphooligosaccharide--protein glycosyltransferase subunit 1A [Ricinus communis]
MGFWLRFNLLILTIGILSTPVLSDLLISKVDRRIDLTSQIVRIASTLKVENAGSGAVSEFLLVFPEIQAKKLAYLTATVNEGKGKTKISGGSLPIDVANPKGMPPALNVYSVSLPKALGEGDTLTLDVLSVFTHTLQPFPEKITQADIQLVLFQESAYYLSPYAVKFQSLNVKLPDARIESYTKIENTKLHGSEIKYGPYENLPPFSYSPVVVHFETNQPFAVAQELVREIEISHWGNVQVTEYYNIVHQGAKSKGEFSRLDYQARPNIRGASAIRHFVAKLPPRAHSIYYRDEIGNISTSHLFLDSKKTELVIEPRYPMFGGWGTTFTVGYSLPLPDFLFDLDGKRFLNISFASPMNELVIDDLTVKVVLPEGSEYLSVSTPFPVKQREESKTSHLDVVGRLVVVLEKTKVVPEHNQYFQVYYRFNKLSMLREPFMLVIGFFFLFVACIVYVHVDLSISKSSPSYLAKLQWDDVRATVQQVERIINQCLATHEKLEASLRDLSRIGDIQACKIARKTADGLLKEYSKELRPLLAFLQSSPTAAHILPKVEELVAKEKELQERLIAKHTAIVDCYEKKLGGREIENRVASQQQKVVALRQEVEDILEYIDEI